MRKITTIILVLVIITLTIVSNNKPYIDKSIIITNTLDYDYTEDYIIDALSLFQDERWADLPAVDKLQALQTVANIERRTLKFDQLIAVTNSENTETYESCFLDDILCIGINANYLVTLSPYDAIHIICVEAKRIQPPIDLEEILSQKDEKNKYYYEREVYFKHRYNNYYRHIIYEPGKMWGVPLIKN